MVLAIGYVIDEYRFVGRMPLRYVLNELPKSFTPPEQDS
jgi:hypothetical protein